jgi:hypothetical protein
MENRGETKIRGSGSRFDALAEIAGHYYAFAKGGVL